MPKLVSHHQTETLQHVKALPLYATFGASAAAACTGEVSVMITLAFSSIIGAE